LFAEVALPLKRKAGKAMLPLQKCATNKKFEVRYIKINRFMILYLQIKY